MNDLLTASRLVLAVARVTRLIVEDEITQPIRNQVAARQERGKGWDLLDTAINCHACSSVWAGAAVLVGNKMGRPGRFILDMLAASEGALLVHAVTERIDR